METVDEYFVSYDHFKKILKNSKDILGPHAIKEIETLVTILDLKKKYLFSYNYIGMPTLGFKGNSIVEASFSSTKRSKKVISTRNKIDKSCYNLINHSKEKEKKEIKNMRKE
mmetsp:Transcript_20487/g.28813  ORF Transcript_20487/g.28813 Transcript_20487/m.28813 type:complete len:112 (+) Transcript_20487:203-538(+)